MKVLVTGGAGYLGGALTDILRHSKYEVTVYDSLVFEDHYLKGVPFVYGDIRDRKKLQPLLDNTDVVIWLSAIVGDGACALNPDLSAEVNQESVEWLANNFNGRIIFPSTCSVYGANDNLLDEYSPTHPLSIYAATKLTAEEYLKNKNAIIFRLGTLFGVGDQFSRIRMDLVVNVLTARAFYEKKLRVFGGEQYRPLLHVRRAARAIADNIATTHTGIYNLKDENIKILELAKQITNVVPAQIEIVETSFEDSRNYKVSSQKYDNLPIIKTIGNTIEDGVQEVLHLLESGRIKDFNNPRYSNAGYLEIVHGTKNN